MTASNSIASRDAMPASADTQQNQTDFRTESQQLQERLRTTQGHTANNFSAYDSAFHARIALDRINRKSKKSVLNPEDMLDEKLVSDAATLQEQQQTLIELLDQMQAKIDQLKLLIDKNPELATLHIVGFNPTTAILKSVREAMWGIFNATGKFIGRNSAEVIAEEAKIMLYKIAKSRQQEVENAPIDTVVDEIVMPNLYDEDLKNIANPTHSAINLSIYRTTMSRLYYALQRRRYRAA